MHLKDEYEHDEEAGQAGLRLLAHSLVEFAAQQDLRLDPFALGPASRALGRSLTMCSMCQFPSLHMLHSACWVCFQSP